MDCQEVQSRLSRAQLCDICDDELLRIKHHLMDCPDCERAFLDKVNGSIFQGMLSLRDEAADVGSSVLPSVETAAVAAGECPAVGAEFITTSMTVVGQAATEKEMSEELSTDGLAGDVSVRYSSAGGETAAVVQPQHLAPADSVDFSDFYAAHGLDCSSREQIARAWWQGFSSIVCASAEHPPETEDIFEILARIESSASHCKGCPWTTIYDMAEQFGQLRHLLSEETALAEGSRQAMSQGRSCQVTAEAERAEPTLEEYECVRRALSSKSWATAQQDGDAAVIEQVGKNILNDVHMNLTGPFSVRSVCELERTIEQWSIPFLMGTSCVPSVPQSAVA